LLGGIALHVARLVPQPDHRARRLVLVAERAQARRAEHEEPAVDARFEPEPTRRQHPDEVAAREQQDVPPDRAHAPDHRVGPRADLPGRLASRAAVAEELPARTLRPDLGGAAALVLAVVPLDEIRIDLGDRGETAQLARPERTPEGTREYLGERQLPQPLAEPARVALAAFRERDVRESGVLPRERPRRLAVTRHVL